MTEGWLAAFGVTPPLPPQTDALKMAREAFERMPEPYEYLTKDQLKDIRPYMDALHNWKHRYATPFMEQIK